MPLPVTLRSYLEEELRRDRVQGRGGWCLVERLSRRSTPQPWTVGQSAWATANDHEQEAAEAEGREPDLLRPVTLHECRRTFDVYRHFLPGSRDEVRERMDSYLRRSDGSPPA